eukprot:3028421-Rhodomonas_salina.2
MENSRTELDLHASSLSRGIPVKQQTSWAGSSEYVYACMINTYPGTSEHITNEPPGSKTNSKLKPLAWETNLRNPGNPSVRGSQIWWNLYREWGICTASEHLVCLYRASDEPRAQATGIGDNCFFAIGIRGVHVA